MGEKFRNNEKSILTVTGSGLYNVKSSFDAHRKLSWKTKNTAYLSISTSNSIFVIGFYIVLNKYLHNCLLDSSTKEGSLILLKGMFKYYTQLLDNKCWAQV